MEDIETDQKKEKTNKRQCDVDAGSRLRRLLDEKEVSITELAAAWKMSPGQATKLFSGMHGLNTEKMRIIFEDYHITPNEYVLSEEERTSVDTLETYVRGIKTILEKMPRDEQKNHLKEYLRMIADYIGE